MKKRKKENAGDFFAGMVFVLVVFILIHISNKYYTEYKENKEYERVQAIQRVIECEVNSACLSKYSDVIINADELRK